MTIESTEHAQQFKTACIGLSVLDKLVSASYASVTLIYTFKSRNGLNDHTEPENTEKKKNCSIVKYRETSLHKLSFTILLYSICGVLQLL